MKGLLIKDLLYIRQMGRVLVVILLVYVALFAVSGVKNIGSGADSIIVMHEGQIVAYFPDAGKISELELGKYMLGIEKQSDAEIKEVCHGQ